MRDQHERAGKVDQVFFENFERRNVEVVGRLVEQQKVGRLKHELRDQDARAFASGKASNGLTELLAGEEESRRPSSDVNDAVAKDDGIAVGSKRAAQGNVGIERAASDRSRRCAAGRRGESRRWSAARSPCSKRSRVVLPLPFGPTRPTRIPAVTMKLRLSKSVRRRQSCRRHFPVRSGASFCDPWRRNRFARLRFEFWSSGRLVLP